MNAAKLKLLIETVGASDPDWGAAFLDASLDAVCADIYDAYRGSLDAAKRLHDALLPGRGAALNIEAGCAAVYGEGIDGKVNATSANNPARAWLLAILRAKAAEAGRKAGH